LTTNSPKFYIRVLTLSSESYSQPVTKTEYTDPRSIGTIYYLGVLSLTDNSAFGYESTANIDVRQTRSYYNDDQVNIIFISNWLDLKRGCSEPENVVLDTDQNNFLKVTFNIPSYLGNYTATDLKYKITWLYTIFSTGESERDINEIREEYYTPLNNSTSITFTSQTNNVNGSMQHKVFINAALYDFDGYFPYSGSSTYRTFI
jgi:hypothetical protein